MPYVTGYFSNQAAAVAAVDKLLGRGVPRDRILMTSDESVGNSPASSNAPANVLSASSDLGQNRSTEKPAGRGTASDRTVTPSNPRDLGRSSVAVTTDDNAWNESSLRDFLHGAGAQSIFTDSDESLPRETYGVWPPAPEGDAVDVERAIAASRRGAADDDAS